MKNNEAILIRYGEIGLKGGNRSLFEKALCRNLAKRLDREPGVKIVREYGRIWIYCEGDTRAVIEKVSGVFGVVGVRHVFHVANDWRAIEKKTLELLKADTVSSQVSRTFAVRAKRNFKGFPKTSEDIGRDLGSKIMDQFPQWHVDLTSPQVRVRVEIHRDFAFVSIYECDGPGGLPVGTAGPLGILLSGGIDSPVAGYMAQRRGATLVPIYFHSFPYTGDQALNKVIDLSRVLAVNQDRMNLYIVHFTKIQEAIHEACDAHYSVVLNRRMMMRMSDAIRKQVRFLGIVTGECMGQVASQTLENMAAVGAATQLPIYRPLLSYDKTEITRKARAIGTYDISIRPFEDCCTLFVHRHPVTHAEMQVIEKEESKINIPGLIEDSLAQLRVEKIK